MKVLTPDSLVYYPDVMAACAPEPGDPQLEDGPCPVVEPVSPDKGSTDRREEPLANRNIPAPGVVPDPGP